MGPQGRLTPPKRLTAQQQQEGLSRTQFEEALDGWVCNPQTHDFGEDYLISIFDEGHSTGLNFLVQLKSARNWEKLVSKKQPGFVRYSLKVKDLLHWEDTFPPVVIAVWDVDRRVGFWDDVPALIVALDAGGMGWRKQTSATVSIPIDQKLDAVGKANLRRRIGDFAVSTLAKGKRLEITHRFRDTHEARAQAKALRRAIEEGDVFTFDGKHLDKFELSEWYERIFGKIEPAQITVSPRPTTIPLPFEMKAVGAGPPESICLDLQPVKKGTKVGVFESPVDHPLKIRFAYDARDISLSFRMSFSLPCGDVDASLELVRFLKAVRNGATVQLGLSRGPVIVPSTDAFKVGPTLEDLEFWYHLLVKLSEIQPRIAPYGTFAIKPPIADKDLETLEEMHAMCVHGVRRLEKRFSLKLAGRLDPRSPGPIPPDARADAEEKLVVDIDPYDDLVLFGVRVPAGKVRITCDEDPEITQKIADARAGKKILKISGKSATVTYLDWQEPHRRQIETAKARRLISKHTESKSQRERV